MTDNKMTKHLTDAESDYIDRVFMHPVRNYTPDLWFDENGLLNVDTDFECYTSDSQFTQMEQLGYEFAGHTVRSGRSIVLRFRRTEK